MTDGSIDFTFLVASGADCAAFLGLVPASCPIVLLRLLAPRGATGFSAAMICRSEERRVGNECGSTFKSWWLPDREKQKSRRIVSKSIQTISQRNKYTIRDAKCSQANE